MNSTLNVSQNFLKDPTLIEKLLSITNLSVGDVVYDIGAGKGIIAKELSKKCKKVVAIEYDPALFNTLQNQFKDQQNVQLINADFLKLNLPTEPYKVFSNIPFNISSEIINKLLFSLNPPTDTYLIVQKETALRYLGVGEGTLISLLLKPIFEMEITHTFKKTDFEPQPNVDTVLFKITKRPTPLINTTQYNDYRDFITYALNQQKPTLKLRLNKIFTSNQFYKLCQDLEINTEVMAKNVTFDQWLGLFNYYLIGVEQTKKSMVQGSFERYFYHKDLQKKVHRTKIINR